ncbi:cobalamin biosynthesis protein [Halegenticoccus soli]|uniref:cobalamin biosynthesis protein n=1 Tax=Halegenticoccus soli TaxID=1985678 RepID=UPI000C6E8BA4|nr:cobalamin biosynthesis protein [Halegenticoccus soli]
MSERPTETAAVEPPADLLAGRPTTAYFWGHVAGSGDVADDGLEVVTGDEESAETLAAIAGGDLDRGTNVREYAHDASITRTEEEYALTVEREDLFGRSGSLGLPVDGRGNYRFAAFAGHDRELLRGLFEGCGTICFKSSTGTVGVSFVHDDGNLLALVRELIADCPVEAMTGDLSKTSSGGRWFSVDDADAADFGTWLYEGAEETGLYAPSRRRKLVRSLERAEAFDA